MHTADDQHEHTEFATSLVHEIPVLSKVMMSPNKEAAITFLQLAARGEVAEAYERFVAAEFTHHNQYFAGDRQSLLTAMQEAAARMPEKTFEIKYVYDAGDTVVTHSLFKPQPNHPGIAVVHIARFVKSKIVELWDVGQALSADSPNQNGAF